MKNKVSDATASQLHENVGTAPVLFTNTSASLKPKLPKLTLPRFKGLVTQWNTVWDSYESAIHANDNISRIDKFNYLKSLLEGPALRAIQGLTLSNANYDAAIDILKDRFGQPQQIVSAHMDEILKIQACNGERLSSLRYVYDKISVHVRGLASIGVSSEQYGSLLIPIIMSKLPNDIRLQIARKISKDVWKIDELLEIIKFEKARELSEATKTSGNSLHDKDNTKKYNPPTASSLVTKTKDGDVKIQCVYCNGFHYSASCNRFVNFKARKKILAENRRCFNCLRKGHQVRDWTSPRKCRFCSTKHHTSICF